jgi:hypothetical protein
MHIQESRFYIQDRALLETVAWPNHSLQLGGWQIETADRVLRFGVAGLSRKEMSAIEKAIRENSGRYHFEVQEVEVGEQASTETPAQIGASTNGGPTKPPANSGVAGRPPSVS